MIKVSSENLTYLLSCQCFVFLHQYLRSIIFLQVNKNPLRPVDPSRLMNVGPDFTPSYLGNLGRGSVGGPRGPVSTFLQLSMLVYYETTSLSLLNEFVLLKKVPFFFIYTFLPHHLAARATSLSAGSEERAQENHPQQHVSRRRRAAQQG